MQIERSKQAGSPSTGRARRERRLAGTAMALGLAAGLAGCGGASKAEATPGVATIGAAGGTVADAPGPRSCSRRGP